MEKGESKTNLPVGVLAEIPIGRRFVEEDDELLAFGGGEAARIVEGKGEKHLEWRENGRTHDATTLRGGRGRGLR